MVFVLGERKRDGGGRAVKKNVLCGYFSCFVLPVLFIINQLDLCVFACDKRKMCQINILNHFGQFVFQGFLLTIKPKEIPTQREMDNKPIM